MEEIFLDTTEPEEPGLVRFLEDNNIYCEIVNTSGPGGGFPEIKYCAKREILKDLILKFWGDRELFNYIKTMPEEKKMGKKLYKIITDQSNIKIKKYAIDDQELEKICEDLEDSGFLPNNIWVQGVQNDTFLAPETWEDIQLSKVSVGQILGCFQDAIGVEFEGGISYSAELISGEGLEITFETGEEFIVSVSQK